MALVLHVCRLMCRRETRHHWLQAWQVVIYSWGCRHPGNHFHSSTKLKVNTMCKLMHPRGLQSRLVPCFWSAK